MHKAIILLVVLLIIHLVSAQDSCHDQCIMTGYSSGTCRQSEDSCFSYESPIKGIANCTAIGKASMIIGSGVIDTYSDGNAYIDEDATAPDWIWVLKNLKSNEATNIADTSDASQHSGILIGVKNKFTAKSVGSTTTKDAYSVGESVCLPGSSLCIKFDSLTVSNYSSYAIKKETADLSSINSTWSSKSTILIQSIDDADGLNLQIGPNITTDKIWLAQNYSDFITIAYEDSGNVKQPAADIQMTGNSVNIADINYQNTKGDDVQINLDGNAATQDNLNIVIDIIGDEGLAKTNGYDDLTIQLSHAASGDFDGIGDTPSLAETSEISWRSTNIGKKTNDLLTAYGIKILAPNTNGESDKVLLEMPGNQVKAKIKIMGQGTSTSENIVTQNTTAKEGPSPVTASEIDNFRNYNLILIGGPCANPLVTALFGLTCVDWLLSPGQGIIALNKNGDYYTSMLIAGTTADDTKAVSDFIVNSQPLNGTSVIIKNGKVSSTEKAAGLELAEFPKPFIVNADYNEMLVVLGDNADIRDAEVAVKVMSRLIKETGRNEVVITNTTEELTTTSGVEDEIPLGNNIADTGLFTKILAKTEIGTLQDREVTIGTQNYNVRDKLVLFNSGPIVQTSLTAPDDNYGSSPYLELPEGRLRYYYTFEEAADLSTLSSSNPLEIELLGNEVSVSSVTASSMIVEAANAYLFNVGESVNVGTRKVSLLDVNPTRFIVSVDGNQSIVIVDERKTINGVNIIAHALFSEEKSSCCCFDVLAYFR